MPQWSIQIALLKFNLLSPHATLTLTTALTPIIREFFSSTNRVVLMYTCNPLHFFKILDRSISWCYNRRSCAENWQTTFCRAGPRYVHGAKLYVSPVLVCEHSEHIQKKLITIHLYYMLCRSYG